MKVRKIPHFTENQINNGLIVRHRLYKLFTDKYSVIYKVNEITGIVCLRVFVYYWYGSKGYRIFSYLIGCIDNGRRLKGSFLNKRKTKKYLTRLYESKHNVIERRNKRIEMSYVNKEYILKGNSFTIESCKLNKLAVRLFLKDWFSVKMGGDTFQRLFGV